MIFDELLYKARFVIERTNAWTDAFKAILIRFETNKIHWKALNLLAFCVIFLDDFKQLQFIIYYYKLVNLLETFFVSDTLFWTGIEYDWY